MRKIPSLSIFFPAYNEEKNIALSLEAAITVASKIADLYEVIVVDDGSRDKTVRIVQRYVGANKNVKLVQHILNRGYGEALKSGLAVAQYDYIFFTDADLQFNLTELEQFISYTPGYDVVIGYRKNRQDPLMRLVNANLWNIANRILFGLHARDIDCAFKLLRRSLIQNITLTSSGAMISAEMLLKLNERGARIIELPVAHYSRKEGNPTGAKFSVIFRAFREMWRLYSVELGDKTQIQFLKFAIVGVVNTTTTFVFYVLLSRAILGQSHYLFSEIIAYIMGTVMSFIFNRRWTFREYWRANYSEVLRFATVTVSAVGINSLAMYMLVLFGLHDIASVLVAAVFTVAWNFILSKYWVFRKIGLPSPQ